MQTNPLTHEERLELSANRFDGYSIEDAKFDYELYKKALDETSSAHPTYPRLTAMLQQIGRYIELMSKLNRSRKQSLALIVAATIDGEIGYKNQIPWELRGDLERFRRLTTDNVAIMGLNTFESIGKPLANRINIVVTSRADHFKATRDVVKDLYYVSSIPEALDMASTFPAQVVYFMGGAKIYEQALKIVDTVELTLVHKPSRSGSYDAKIENFRLPEVEWDRRHVAGTTYDVDVEVGIPYPSHTYFEFRRKGADRSPHDLS